MHGVWTDCVVEAAVATIELWAGSLWLLVMAGTVSTRTQEQSQVTITLVLLFL